MFVLPQRARQAGWRGKGGGLGPRRWLSGLCQAAGALARADGTHVSDSLLLDFRKEEKKKFP